MSGWAADSNGTKAAWVSLKTKSENFIVKPVLITTEDPQEKGLLRAGAPYFH